MDCAKEMPARWDQAQLSLAVRAINGMMAEDPENEALLREIPASEILDKIQKGEPVEYDHVRITDDLDLSNLDLPTEHVARTEYQIKTLELPEESKVVSSQIKITNSKFDAKNVNLGNNLFKGSINFNNTIFCRYPYFRGATFSKYAEFRGTTFRGGANFTGATFSGDADFIKVTFNGGADFGEANFSGDTNFIGATFSGYAKFIGTIFQEDVGFSGATFSSNVGFSKATFRGNADFIGTTFSGSPSLIWTKFEGDVLTFRDATFTSAVSQEDGCRRAKNVLEKNGNREEAGYHFYREMDGKRKQKPWYIRYPEYIFVQLIFGYGVHPFRLMFCWFLVALIFAIFYSVNGGIIGKLPASSLPQPWSYFVECFYFSIITAVTPGYGKYELTSWVYQVIASAEAIFGTFRWAAFIATFARKYMR